MSGTSGPTSPKALGFYDPASSSWKTWPPTSDEGSTLSPKTWPKSGMTRRGRLYALPTSGPATAETGSGSSPLLKTPTSQLGPNGGSQHPDKRKAGGHGPTLADEVEWLLPTPHANCATGPGRRGRAGGMNLQTAVAELPIASSCPRRRPATVPMAARTCVTPRAT